MKLTITSPDGIGDFILRLPWLLRMAAQGWQLQILARAPTIELAHLAGLSAEFVPLSLSPYTKEARRVYDPYRKEFRAVKAFRPECVFLGPSQPSVLEEQLGACLREARVGGFRMRRGFWPGEGLEDPRDLCAKLSFHVDIDPEDSEPRRNAKAADFFLGADSNLPLPAFKFSQSLYASLGGADGCEVVVNAAVRDGDHFKGWGEGNWTRELKPVAEDAPLVFVGSNAEVASHARIFAALSAGPEVHRNVTGSVPDLRSLCRVLAASKGYVGKDCGVMHLAAAFGKPVLAVFGGGHWPRFLPVGTKAVVLTAKVPCRGCDWRCHLDEPICVKGLPQGCLGQAWGELNALPSGQTKVLEFVPALEELGFFPAKDYPRKVHSERRARLREERAALLNSPWRMWTERAKSAFHG